MQYKGNLLLHIVLISITLIGSIVFFVLESIWNCSCKPNDLAISYSLIGFILLGICLFTAVMICCKITEPSLSRDNSVPSSFDSYYFVERPQNRNVGLDKLSVKNEYSGSHQKIPIEIHNPNFNRLMGIPVEMLEQGNMAGGNVHQLETARDSTGTTTIESSSQTDVVHLKIPARMCGKLLKASIENQRGIY